jgi:hypothetical protein
MAADNFVSLLVIILPQIVYLHAEEDLYHTIEVVLPSECLVLKTTQEVYPLFLCLELWSQH